METTIKWCNKKITLILSLIYKTILLSHYIIFNLCAPFLRGIELHRHHHHHRASSALGVVSTRSDLPPISQDCRATPRDSDRIYHDDGREESVRTALICRHKFTDSLFIQFLIEIVIEGMRALHSGSCVHTFFLPAASHTQVLPAPGVIAYIRVWCWCDQRVVLY